MRSFMLQRSALLVSTGTVNAKIAFPYHLRAHPGEGSGAAGGGACGHLRFDNALASQAFTILDAGSRWKMSEAKQQICGLAPALSLSRLRATAPSRREPEEAFFLHSVRSLASCGVLANT